MGNKIKYNLKNVHAAVLTETTSSNGVTYSYDTPEPIPGAVSLSLDAEGESSPFYADGVVYFRSATNNGYSGELELALIPEWFRTDIRPLYVPARSGVCRARTAAYWVIDERYVK